MSLGDVMQNRLRELRKARGYTQVSVQMQTGIEQALLSKYESGERIPPTESLVRLAEFYNVSIDYIAGTKQFDLSDFKEIREDLKRLDETLGKVISHIEGK